MGISISALTLSREEIKEAITGSNPSKCRKLAKLVNVNVDLNDRGVKPIHMAITYGKYDAVKHLVANNAMDVNSRLNPNNIHCLALAVTPPNVSSAIVMELLKRRDLHINAVNGDIKRTALMIAVLVAGEPNNTEGMIDIVNMIAGDPRCDLQTIDNQGCTALTYAVYTGKVAMVNQLVRDGRGARHEVKEIVRCFHDALLKERIEIAQLISDNSTQQQKYHIVQHTLLQAAAEQQRETGQRSPEAQRQNQRSEDVNITSLPPNIHFGICCDVCSSLHFTGPRYKCVVCVNYDLCGTCRSRNMTSDSHSNQHAMECLMPPMIRVGSVVKLISNQEELKQLQRGYNGWTAAKLAKIKDLPGIVQSFLQNGDLIVDFNNMLPIPWLVGPTLMICNPSAVRLFSKDEYEGVDARGNLFKKDDKVKIMDKETVMSALSSVGRIWNESFSVALGISGRVLFFDRHEQVVVGILKGIDRPNFVHLPAKAVLLVTGTTAARIPADNTDLPSYSALFE